MFKYWKQRSLRTAIFFMALLSALPALPAIAAPAAANPATDARLQKAFALAYNLDHDEAVKEMRSVMDSARGSS